MRVIFETEEDKKYFEEIKELVEMGKLLYNLGFQKRTKNIDICNYKKMSCMKYDDAPNELRIKIEV